MNDYVDLKRLLKLLAEFWWVLLGTTSLLAAIGYFLSSQQTPVYAAKTTLFVGVNTRNPSIDTNDIETSELLLETYAELAERQPVLQSVVDALGLQSDWESLGQQVSTNAAGRQLLEIIVLDKSPTVAEDIAQELANQLILISPNQSSSPLALGEQQFVTAQLQEVQQRIINGQLQLQTLARQLDATVLVADKELIQSDIDNLQRLISGWEETYLSLLEARGLSETASYLSLLEPARAGLDPVQPRPLLQAIVYGVLGFVLGLGALLLHWLFNIDGQPDSAENDQAIIERSPVRAIPAMQQTRPITMTGQRASNVRPASLTLSAEPIQLLGRVEYIDNAADMANQHASTSSESMVWSAGRGVSYQVWLQAQRRKTRTLVITSMLPREGKTTVAVHLAARLAALGESVALIDANVNRPILHELFNLPLDIPGVGDLLLDGNLNDIAPIPTYVPGLSVLPIGSQNYIPPNSLRPSPLARLTRQLAEQHDFVFIEVPAIENSHLSDLMAPFVDGMILVDNLMQYDQTKRELAYRRLKRAGAKFVGVVENAAGSIVTPRSEEMMVAE